MTTHHTYSLNTCEFMYAYVCMYVDSVTTTRLMLLNTHDAYGQVFAVKAEDNNG